MSFKDDENYKDGGFEIEYIRYIVANDLDFGRKDQANYEEDYDGDVPQVTYMPYVFMMQEAYAKRQEEEKEKAKKFSAVFIPIDNLIMKFFKERKPNNPYIEEGVRGDRDRAEISNFKNFKELNKAFHDHIGQYFFDYIKRPSSNDASRGSVPSTHMGIPKMQTGLNSDEMGAIKNPFSKTRKEMEQGIASSYGGHRRSHKSSQKKTSKGKSRSRSRSRSKTRSKSKSKSKTRAKSKSKRR